MKVRYANRTSLLYLRFLSRVSEPHKYAMVRHHNVFELYFTSAN